MFEDHLIANQKVEIEKVDSSNGWFNISNLMGVEPLTTYLRGFRYRHHYKDPDVASKVEEGTVHLTVDLWLGHAYIDAVSCLYSPAKAKRFKNKSASYGSKP